MTDTPTTIPATSRGTAVCRSFTLNGIYGWSKTMQAMTRLNGELSPLEYVISDQDRAHIW